MWQRRLLRWASLCAVLATARDAGAEAGVAAAAPRERCRVLTASGTRAEAIAACDRAVGSMATARDMRAAVAALMRGPEWPTTDDFFRAHLLAEAAAAVAPGEPWGAAAHLDLALRWGDPALVALRLREAERVSPGHAEVLRAKAELGRGRAGALAVGWGGLGLLLAATLWRALRGGRSLGRTVPLAGALVLLLGAGLPRRAAASGEVFPIDDANPVASVPPPERRDARPLDFGYFLQDLAGRAEAASKRGDHAAAARYFLATAKAVPDSAIGFARACRELEVLGRRDEAITACRAALGRPGVVLDDTVRLVRLVLGKTGPLPAADVDDLRAVADHLIAGEETRATGQGVACELALRMDDLALLRSCTAGLGALAPSDARTISFQWALAVKEGQAAEARRLVTRAREVGVASSGVERMEAATAVLEGRGLSRLRDWRLVLPTLVVLGGVAAALALRHRGRSGPTPV